MTNIAAHTSLDQPVAEPQAAPSAPEVEKVIYINLFDEINAAKVKVIMAHVTQLVTQQKPDVLYFLFSSSGGQVQAGITLFNFLKALPVRVVMHNTGSIDSIATVIFLAGDERYASHGTSFLFHGVGMPVNAPMRLTSASLTEMHSRLREDEKKIAAIVSRHTGLSTSNLRKLFNRGESKDLDFALKKGIIQEIRDANIPRDAQLISFNLQ